MELGRDWGLLDYLFRVDPSHSDTVTGFLTNDFEELAPEAHLIGASPLSEIASWLSQISNRIFFEAFDPKAMLDAEVYDAELAAQNPDEYRLKLEAKIDAVRSFVTKAADDHQAIVRVIA